MSQVGLEPWLFNLLRPRCCASRQLAELPTQSTNKQWPSVEYVSDYVYACAGYRIDYSTGLTLCPSSSSISLLYVVQFITKENEHIQVFMLQ